jgi:hypothetical protein
MKGCEMRIMVSQNECRNGRLAIIGARRSAPPRSSARCVFLACLALFTISSAMFINVLVTLFFSPSFFLESQILTQR